jgi:hypothetical protein
MLSRAQLLIVAAFLVVGGPLVLLSITGHLGFAADDYWQLCGLQSSAYPGGPDAQNLFRFWSGAELNLRAMQTGAVPWYADPDLRIVFWRPLTTALHRLDFALFGATATGAKIHGLLWYALLTLGVALVFRRVIADERARLVAVFAFVVCAAHWQIVAWIAARNATALAVLALLCHLRWRQNQWRAGAVLAPLVFAVALSAGEAALGVLGYVVATELAGIAPGTVRDRLLAAAPMLVVAVVWLGLYSAQSFGTVASGGYLDPTHEPLVFLTHLPERLLALHGMQYMGFPPGESGRMRCARGHKPGHRTAELVRSVGAVRRHGRAHHRGRPGTTRPRTRRSSLRARMPIHRSVATMVTTVEWCCPRLARSGSLRRLRRRR